MFGIISNVVSDDPSSVTRLPVSDPSCPPGNQRCIRSVPLRHCTPLHGCSLSHPVSQQSSLSDHQPVINTEAVEQKAEDQGSNRYRYLDCWQRERENGSGSHLSSVAKTLPPLSEAIIPIICCNLSFARKSKVDRNSALAQSSATDGQFMFYSHPTPPTINTSALPTCAIARSVISTNIE